MMQSRVGDIFSAVALLFNHTTVLSSGTSSVQSISHDFFVSDLVSGLVLTVRSDEEWHRIRRFCRY